MIGTRIRVHHTSAIAGALLLAGVAACSDAAGTGRAPVTLSFSGMSSTPVPTAAMSGPSLSVGVTSGTNTVVITKAEVVLSHVELSRVESTDCIANGEDTECEEMKVDPMLVELPVTPSVTQEISVTLPAGTYRQFEAEIRAPHAGEPGADAFLAAHPTFAGKSLHVEGTYNGTPFTYDGAPEAEFHIPFNPPLSVATTSPNNVTVRVDISSWFKDQSGNVIDPTNLANAGTIVENIKKSFHAFEDDDRDGRE